MSEGVEGVFREAAVEEGEGKELLREVPGVALEHSEGDLGQLLVEGGVPVVGEEGKEAVGDAEGLGGVEVGAAVDRGVEERAAVCSA